MTDRLDDLERRVAALEKSAGQARSREAARPRGAQVPPPATATRFWALDELHRQTEGTTGAILFTGTWQPTAGVAEAADVAEAAETAEAPAQESARAGVDWQYARSVDDLMDHDWSVAASPLAALGHPVRLELLKRVLSGTTATRDLAESEGLGTSGQLHHHLRALVAAGWLRQRQRGDYEVPGERIIPLMTVLVAALG
ncbi:ArsR/SmtB family transcription factor [Granulicoccus sp. GXG6511]|uniref:ArsR/SmtB family transcription factor n=1 Tax=Granulicoccus sp. GXG6511 TaxID=3381351 RepID=UPI003D7DA8F9